MNKRAEYIEHLVDTWQPRQVKQVSQYQYGVDVQDLAGFRWLFPSKKRWQSVCLLDLDMQSVAPLKFPVVTAIYFPAKVLDDLDSFIYLSFTVRRPENDFRLDFHMSPLNALSTDDSVIHEATGISEQYVRMDLFSPGFMAYNLTGVSISLCSKLSESLFVEVLYLPEKWETQTFVTGEWDVTFDDRGLQWYRCSDPTVYQAQAMLKALDEKQRDRQLWELDRRIKPVVQQTNDLYQFQFSQ